MAKLSERAVLIHVRIRHWNGSKRNPKVSDELCTEKGAAQDAATVIVNYIPKDKLVSLHRKANKIRGIFVKWSRPWLDGGIRIIALRNLPKYDKEMKEAIDDYNETANRWVKEKYPKILKCMPDRLAKLLDDQPMPSPLEVLNKFRIQTNKFPVPDASDILISGEEGTLLRKEVSSSINATLQKTMLDVWNELTTLINRIQERLSDPNKKFKDSLIKNLQAFCERIPTENFTDDEQLETIRKEVLKKLAEVDPQDLRENPKYRKAKANKAKDILSSIRKIDLDLE